MTTIACDGKTMACDGQREHRGTVTNYQAVKIARLADGSLVGTAGDVGFGRAVVEWLDKKEGDPPKECGDGGFTCLQLKPTGELLLGGEDCRMSEIAAPFAIGSGMDLAIGAMAAGLDAATAVSVACRFDSGSGGSITVMCCNETAE